ncbi:MAG: APC family permease [Chloroflexi bacterium]|nr:APC family permease [Chloroflexota bacterium]
MPATPAGRLVARIKAVALGRPLHSDEEAGERLSKKKALAIFSSDAISSSAYATEEIVLAFILVGAGGLAIGLALPVAIAIAVLLGVVAFSYRQVCIAYPTGGGSYSVSKENFGRLASLVAASALLIDYNLTAAVSTSSAVEQIASAFPALSDARVWIGVAALGLITLANLRGVREAGNIFAVPTYLFLFSALAMIAIGAYRILVLGEGNQPPPPEVVEATRVTAENVGIFILLRAFASGAVALTGTEAIATGVPAFQPPEPRNASRTLMTMAGILAVLFIGITYLATNFAIYPIEEPKQTVIAQVARTVYGDNVAFYAFQGFTALLLFLAANTSFAAFPRLAAVLAEDGFFPRQFSFRGDRLAFSMGIILLGIVAASLVVAAGGKTHALIPLYAVGVFIDFTISQAGMIRHWLRTREPGWRYRLAVNAVGCVATGVVAVVVTTVKFADGAWLVVVLIPILVALMLFVRREYDAQAAELHVRDDLVIAGPQRDERVIVPVNGINRAVIQAVIFGRSVADDVRAVFVTTDREEGDALRERWERQIPSVPLVIVESPYRALVGPVLAYLDVLDQAWPPDRPAPVTIVVLPEYVARHWWDRLLYNQTARRLKAALLGREHTVVADVPYRRTS